MFRTLLLVLAGLLLWSTPVQAQSTTSEKPMNNILAIPYSNVDGTTETLSQLGGKAYVVVNTASRCGYTPQYGSLETLHGEMKDKGVVVVAFPSNDFGGQEPGSNAQILDFCRTNYNVSFPIKSKVSTKGATKSPLYAALTSAENGHPGEVGWNFEKFVVDGKGRVVARFKSSVRPDSAELRSAIEAALAAK